MKLSPKRKEQGMTMLEVVVALMVIGVIVVSITPPLVMSVAIRVRNYRTQQAMQLAQGEIERVRLLVERGELKGMDLINQLPPYIPPGSNDFTVDDTAPPTTNPNPSTCPQINVNGSTQVTSWCAVDIDGDNQWDMGIQSFRTMPPPEVVNITRSSASDTLGQPIAFVMGVRVYTRAALQSGRPGSVSFDNVNAPKIAPLNFSSGQALSHPLVYLKTAIVRSDLNISNYSFCQLIKRDPSLGGSSTTCPTN